MGKHSLGRDKNAIAYHYDVSNDFYRHFLGKDMVYSCAYFRSGEEGIDEAQANKLEHICRKLRLRPGDRLLDIGCGWGGMIVYAAREYGVQALGITLSRQQYEYAKERIEREGLGGVCRVELRDYRELEESGRFDKVVSIGMFEHVGIKNLPVYFGKVSRLLHEEGLFLNHGITTDKKEKGDDHGTRFVNTYVFPEGELATISHLLGVAAEAGFEVLDLEALRAHYARTLRHWATNLQSRKDELRKIVDEKTYRIWLIYIAASAYGFEKGKINIYQALLSKSRHGLSPVPLTRADLYR